MSSSVAAVPLKAGVDVGGWTLIKKLGQGTFSDVWSGKICTTWWCNPAAQAH
jgi:hypothetical protein